MISVNSKTCDARKGVSLKRIVYFSVRVDGRPHPIRKRLEFDGTELQLKRALEVEKQRIKEQCSLKSPDKIKTFVDAERYYFLQNPNLKWDLYLRNQLCQDFALVNLDDGFNGLFKKQWERFKSSHQNHSPSLRNKYLSLAQAILRFGERKNVIDKRYLPDEEFVKEEEPGRDRYITDAEFAAILECLSPFRQQIIYDLYRTGARVSELCNLRKGPNVNLFTKKISVTSRKGRGKKLKVRSIAIPDESLSYYASTPQDCQYIYYIEKDGKYRPMNKDGINQAFQRAAKRAGVLNVHVHDLRGKCVSDMFKRLVEAGETEERAKKTVMKIVGHVSESMFRLYLKVGEDDISKAMRLTNSPLLQSALQTMRKSA